MECECEYIKCKVHETPTDYGFTFPIQTIYGTFNLCRQCKKENHMPEITPQDKVECKTCQKIVNADGLHECLVFEDRDESWNNLVHNLVNGVI